ncbi:MFS transporter [Caviibacter abscessus]|uniref:MFS transporter n=1 Tax=Caviibacter abscessus TaxID=1766719 RepID=UPI0012E39416|nr:MFS transporter [Caviibacter abscessus]
MLDQLFVQWLNYFYLPPENSTLQPILTARYLIFGFIFMRFIDSIADPIVGYMSDHNNSKFGRRSFFMIIGGIPLALSMILFYFPQGNSQLQLLAYFSIIGAVYFIAYTLVGGPYNSLIPDLANTKNERINLSTVQSIFRLVFTAIPMILSPKLIAIFSKGSTELHGFRKTIILFSLLSLIGVYACALFLGEREIKNKKEISKGASFRETVKQLYNREIILYFLGFFFFFSAFNILRNVINYYVVIVMGKSTSSVTLISVIIFGIAAIFFPITNKLTKIFGFKKMMISNISAIILGTIGLMVFRNNNLSIIYFFYAIIGTGISGAAFIFPPAMLSEISTGIANKTGISVEGLLFGIQGFFLKLAFMVQAIISISALIYNSKPNSLGLKSASYDGVMLSLLIAVILFILSMIFYTMKKNEI